MTVSPSYIDASLESKAREVEGIIGKLEKKPSYNTVRTLARAMQGLKFEIVRTLPFYGAEYEHRGRKFLELGQRAESSATLVPERITRTDPGADRSAHALISRSSQEIATHVNDICAAIKEVKKNR